ncbi:GNAT family N-acetyltransferase [Candidatus Gottesmanbacteria bacterium]|nr:GNAT family N-acetyltransferase [Candidatus Gottesmanbacteria bacterium]
MILIRPVLLKELKHLASIYVASYNSINIGEKWNTKTAFELMRYFFQQQPDLFFTAFVEKRLAGATVAMVKPWWDGNHLIDGEVFVDPRYQKKGIGTKLIKKLFQTANQKYRVISWDTYTHIVYDHPLTWYKTLGFKNIRSWTMISGNVKRVLKNISNEN